MMDARVDDLLRQVKEIRQEIVTLRRGGCICEKPEWYFATLIFMYRCSNCGAVVSPSLLVLGDPT